MVNVATEHTMCNIEIRRFKIIYIRTANILLQGEKEIINTNEIIFASSANKQEKK